MKYVARDASGCWQLAPYFAYLEQIRDRLPREVYAFASDVAHYTLDSPTSLHDAWLEELTISEPASGVRSELRQTELTLRLLGPMHDRIQVLHYTGVQRYRVEAEAVGRGHGDVLVHEVRLSEDGLLVHELLFAGGTAIAIECADLRYEEHARTRHPDLSNIPAMVS
jgi:hypothetical protein